MSKKTLMVNYEEVLNSFEDSETLLLIIIAVQPKFGETGLLEERGEWVELTTKEIFDISEEIAGCRLSWTQLFFATNEKKNQTMIIEQLQLSLKALQKPNLESFCIVAKANGNQVRKIQILNSMADELSAKKDFGNCEEVHFRFRNGFLV